MDVTTDNFKKVLVEFDDVIESASFFAIDSEFTGLNTERTSPFNSPSEFYKKICAGTEDYIIIQLGITAFRLSNDDPTKFTYRSYNFYVYPQGRDQVFKCNGTSMTFLAEQNFDFNSLFRKGISCCNQETATKLRTQLEERQRYREDVTFAVQAQVDDVPVPSEEVDNLEEIRKNIKNFLTSKDKENIIINNCNSFQRKLIYQLIEKEFAKTITATSTQKDNAKAILIQRKLSTEQQQDHIKQKNDEDEDENLRLVGLSKLLEKISASKKLIVGHNMFLDLFYLIRQFFEPVPDTLKAFKKIAHKIFPNVLDTKHLCNDRFRGLIPSSVLKHIYVQVQNEPFKLPTIDADHSDYEYKDAKEHEAGYDSYMTGICFIALAKELHVKNTDINSKSEQLRNFLNKIFVMRLTDIFHINLTGNEPIPNRNHVFHIIFPIEWKQSDLVYHFRKYGSIFIRWIDNKSAFISLNNRENAPILLKSIGRKTGVTITTYDAYEKAHHNSDTDDDEENTKKVVSKRKSTDIPQESNQSVSCRPAKSPKLKKESETKNTNKNTAEKLFAEDEEWPQ